MSDPRRDGTRRMRLGVALLVGGLVPAVVAAVTMWGFIHRLIAAPTHPVPGTFTEDLEPGTWLVSVHTGSSTTRGPLRVGRTRIVDVEELRVLGPTGEELPLRSRRNETVTRGDDTYSGVAVVEVEEAGPHTVQMRTARPSRALLTRSISDLSPTDWAAGILGGLGALAVIVGATLVALGALQRRRQPGSTPPSTPAGTPPPPAPPSS